MTPGQKAAAILALIGEDNAGKIIQKIPKHEVKKILRSYQRLPSLSESDVEKIAKEFLKIINDLDSEQNKFTLDNAKKLLKQANSTLKDDKWIDSLSDSFLIEEIRKLIFEIDEKNLIRWLKNEHPQTMSLILSICSPEKSSSLFKLLDENVRCEIILRISQMNFVDSQELENVHEELDKLQKNKAIQETTPGGYEKILNVLQAASVEQREKLLKGIEEKDPKLAEKLLYGLISLSRLADLDPKYLSLLCSQLTDTTLALALRIEAVEIKEKFLLAMSKKRRHILEEDIQNSKYPKKDVEKAVSEVVKKALELKDAGKIVFPWETTLV
jgi:flagellar motor switch protein FliG